MTQTGLSLGTPQYMSPEQAMGERSIDARSDIYAVGAVTYEMLAGDAPFTGSSVQAIVAKVLSERPTALHIVRDTVPPHVEATVLKALAKLPADRYPSAVEFAAALANEHSGARVVRSSVPGPRSRVVISSLSALSVALLALLVWKWNAPRELTPTSRQYLSFPAAESPVTMKAARAIFPDGSAIVYVGRSGGSTHLWVKKRSELHATPINGTSGAASVFVSPDGAWIGFIANNKVYKVPSPGGTLVQVGNAPCTDALCNISESGAFMFDGRIVHNHRDGLVISGTDGQPADSLVQSKDIIGFTAIHPEVLPGSRAVLFTACTVSCNRADIYAVDMTARKKPALLIPFASHPRFVSTGHLLYTDPHGSVFAVPFDVATLKLTGKPVLVLDRENRFRDDPRWLSTGHRSRAGRPLLYRAARQAEDTVSALTTNRMVSGRHD